MPLEIVICIPDDAIARAHDKPGAILRGGEISFRATSVLPEKKRTVLDEHAEAAAAKQPDIPRPAAGITKAELPAAVKACLRSVLDEYGLAGVGEKIRRGEPAPRVQASHDKPQPQHRDRRKEPRGFIISHQLDWWMNAGDTTTTGRQIAAGTGIHETTLSTYRKGKGRATRQTITRIADYFNVSSEEFMNAP